MTDNPAMDELGISAADAEALKATHIDSLIKGSRILVVDDESHHVEQMVGLLHAEGFREVVWTLNPHEGLEMVFDNEPDLIMLDQETPGLTGFEFVERIRAHPHKFRFLPILILTEDASSETRRQALTIGANDIVAKPFDPVEVVLRVQNLLETKRLNHQAEAHADELERLNLQIEEHSEELERLNLQIERHNEELEDLVAVRTSELEVARVEVLERLALAAEFRDDDTRDHTRRVGHNSAMLAEVMGFPRFEVDTLRRASPLHDLGKIGVPDHILLKPGRLTADEFEIIKTHVTIGAEILDGAEYHLLEMAKNIAIAHHEKFDGTGYPHGLRGEDIPIFARMVSVVDVFDALTHKRCYKEAWPVDQAIEELQKQAGKQFDPDCVEAYSQLAFAQRLDI